MDLLTEAMRELADTFARAEATGMRNHNAMSLATVDGEGRPSARVVLLRGIDERGLVFYTDARSRKGAELAARPEAAVCTYWEPLEEQARVEGRVELVDDAEADADFARRPDAGRLMIAAVEQSAPVESDAALRAAIAAAQERLGGPPAHRPEHWVGFRLVPRYVELWRGRRDRVHERAVWRLDGDTWRKSLLAP